MFICEFPPTFIKTYATNVFFGLHEIVWIFSIPFKCFSRFLFRAIRCYIFTLICKSPSFFTQIYTSIFFLNFWLCEIFGISYIFFNSLMSLVLCIIGSYIFVLVSKFPFISTLNYIPDVFFNYWKVFWVLQVLFKNLMSFKLGFMSS